MKILTTRIWATAKFNVPAERLLTVPDKLGQYLVDTHAARQVPKDFRFPDTKWGQIQAGRSADAQKEIDAANLGTGEAETVDFARRKAENEKALQLEGVRKGA